MSRAGFSVFQPTQTMDIRLGEGIGELRFGSSRDEVRAVLGEPDSYFNGLDETDAAETWSYESLAISANFASENDYRLGILTVSEERYQLGGKSLIGERKSTVLDILKGFNLGSSEQEWIRTEDKPTRELVSFDRVSLNLWFNEGRLEAIQWSPFWKGDEEIWPKGPMALEERET